VVDIRKRFHHALRDAGIEGFVFHDLRHTFPSHLAMAGVDLMTVQEFLGHRDIKMTLCYAPLAPDYNRSAMQRLDTCMDTRHKNGVTESSVTPCFAGAGHGSRTRDLRLGKATLYQLS